MGLGLRTMDFNEGAELRQKGMNSRRKMNGRSAAF